MRIMFDSRTQTQNDTKKKKSLNNRVNTSRYCCPLRKQNLCAKCGITYTFLYINLCSTENKLSTHKLIATKHIRIRTHLPIKQTQTQTHTQMSGA